MSIYKLAKSIKENLKKSIDHIDLSLPKQQKMELARSGELTARSMTNLLQDQQFDVYEVRGIENLLIKNTNTPFSEKVGLRDMKLGRNSFFIDMVQAAPLTEQDKEAITSGKLFSHENPLGNETILRNRNLGIREYKAISTKLPNYDEKTKAIVAIGIIRNEQNNTAPLDESREVLLNALAGMPSYGKMFTNINDLPESTTRKLYDNAGFDDSGTVLGLLAKQPNLPADLADKFIDMTQPYAAKVAYYNKNLSREQIDKLSKHESSTVRDNLVGNYYTRNRLSDEQAAHIAENTEDTGTVNKILDRHQSNEKITSAISRNKNSWIQEAYQKHLNEHGGKDYPEKVDVSLNTGKLREARALAESKPNAEVSKKELEQNGLNPRDLGINHLLDAKGNLKSEAISKHIESLPKMKFGISHGTWGEDSRATVANEEEALQEHLDKFDPNDYGVHKSDYIDRDAAQEDWLERFDPEDAGIKREDFESEDKYDNAVRQAIQHHNENFDIGDYADDDNFLNDREYDRAVDAASESHDENFDLSDYGGTSEEGALDTSRAEQRHNLDQSKVFKLNLLPEHFKKLKDLGVYDTFKNVSHLAHSPHHPVDKGSGIGWLRYTESPDGIHIDEIQNDWDLSPERERKRIKGDVEKGTIAPDMAKEKTERLDKLFPQGHVDKIKEVLFNNKDPNEIIHEAFLQHQRNKNQIGKQIHIWQPTPKSVLAHQKIDTDVSTADLANFKKQPALLSPNKIVAIDRFHKENNIQDSTFEEAHQKMFGHSPEKGQFVTKLSVSPPAHMNVTYNDVPKKLGYKQGKYGEIKTQDASDLAGEPTWKQTLKRSFSGVLQKASKQQYLQMFGDKAKVAEPVVDWARKTLGREDRVYWFLRAYKQNPEIFNNDNKLKLEHHASMFEQIPEMDKHVFEKGVSFEDGLNKLKSLEDNGIQNLKDTMVPKKGKKIIDFGDGYGWWDLGVGACSIEGKAMGHCGNKPSRQNGDKILSLRKEKKIGKLHFYEPSVTFIENNGELGEMKGKANEKPNPRYHKYITSLLEHPRITQVIGGGYQPEKNFSLNDLKPEEKQNLLSKKPGLDPFSSFQEIHSEKNYGEAVENHKIIINWARNTGLTQHDDIITRALLGGNEVIRKYAIQHPNATPEHITRALGDSNNYVRRYAIEHPNATPEHITRALGDSDNYVRQYAIEHPNATPEHITRALGDSNNYVRRYAIEHPNATPEHITRALGDSNANVRLSAIQHPNVTPEHITRALGDSDNIVRRNAIRHPKATPEHITRALGDSDEYVRQVAMKIKNKKG